MSNNNIYKWSPQMSVGVFILDEEHRSLILESSALRTIGRTKSRDSLEIHLSRLISIFIKHFFNEESYMAKMHYSQMVEHKESHDAFIVRMQGFLRRIKREDEKLLTMEILRFVPDWVGRHILVDDRCYALEAETRFNQDRLWGGERSN